MKTNKPLTFTLSDLKNSDSCNYSYPEDTNIIAILEKSCKRFNNIKTNSNVIPKRFDKRALSFQSILFTFQKSLTIPEYNELIKDLNYVLKLHKEYEIYSDVKNNPNWNYLTDELKFKKWKDSNREFYFKYKFFASEIALDILTENRHFVLKETVNPKRTKFNFNH